MSATTRARCSELDDCRMGRLEDSPTTTHSSKCRAPRWNQYLNNKFRIKNLILALLIVLGQFEASQQLDTGRSYGEQQDDLSARFTSTLTPPTIKKVPYFGDYEDEPVQRVPIGRMVRFKCVVKDLGKHVISWINRDRRIHIATSNKVYHPSGRHKVYLLTDGVSILEINPVQLVDQGSYMCQINKPTNNNQIHTLEVLKPPQIRENETSTNLEPVKEFGSVELRCVAEGIPRPTIKWRRESQLHVVRPPPPPSPPEADNDGDNNELEREAGTGSRARRELETTVAADPNRQIIGEGEVLRFERVTRDDIGYYHCIASNGVSPSVSQRIFLPVSFLNETKGSSQPPPSTGSTATATTTTTGPAAARRSGAGSTSRFGSSQTSGKRTAAGNGRAGNGASNGQHQQQQQGASHQDQPGPGRPPAQPKRQQALGGATVVVAALGLAVMVLAMSLLASCYCRQWAAGSGQTMR